nr:RNA-directed DNA polymerase, eukaryota, reverse transcriptase zinc-binding domain protein [Tanacetum cinerariifolium]
MRKLFHSQGNIHDRVERLRHELDEVQIALDKDPYSIVLREEEVAYLTTFSKTILDEERFLKHKAKIEWLREGDCNLTYFHRSVKARLSRSVEGNVSYLNTEGLFIKRPSNHKADNMVCGVLDFEIRSVIFSIGNDKVSGPNGFTSVFFKKA